MKHMPWEIMQIYHSTDQQKRTTKFSKAQNVHSHMGEINTGIKKHTHTQIVG